MKKLLILILIVLLLALSVLVVMQGVRIGSIKILGIGQIQEKSERLDAKIQDAARLAEKTYAQAVNEVNTNAKKLEEEKKNYEDMTTISEDSDVEAANQLERYEIETLWVRVGNHATSQGVVMQMDVLPSSSGAKDTYNLRFAATGSYISITDFISAIENDSTLGFKIEEFKMRPSGSNLQAMFVCKDIAIAEVSAITQQDDSDDTENTNNSNETNTENTTDTTNQTNTTNTTGTTSATDTVTVVE